MTMTNPKRLIAAQAFNAGQRDDYESFEEWESNEIVSFTCNDCGKDVYRTKVDWLDVDGLTPVRCGSCTLARGINYE